MGFNENPTERTTMNPKLAKFAVKAALSGVFALAIGYTIKFESAIGDRIDDHFEPATDEDPQQ
jgi:hypothetical protein